MAVVETLEVRFQANVEQLNKTLSGMIGKLSALSATASTMQRTLGGMISAAGAQLTELSSAASASARKQGSLTSKLKGTSRALKGVASAAKAAVEGIGLHKLDEINLVGEQAAAKKSGGGGGGSGGSGGSGGGFAAQTRIDIDAIWEKLKIIPDTLKSVCAKIAAHFTTAFQKIDKATGGMLGATVETIGNIAVSMGRNFVTNLTNALNGGRESAASGGRGLADAMSRAMQSSTAPTAAGSSLIQKVTAAIRGGAAAIRSASSTAAASANFNNSGAQSEAYSAGANLANGFANGITSRVSAITSSVKSVVSAAVSKLRGLLKIASPSKVTYALGGYFGEGFSNGILSTVDAARQSAEGLSAGAVSALKVNPASAAASVPGIAEIVRGAVDAALGETNITVPISVDGIRLGEAAIRGINRVTRSAGRLMLDI